MDGHLNHLFVYFTDKGTSYNVIEIQDFVREILLRIIPNHCRSFLILISFIETLMSLISSIYKNC